MNFAFWMEEKLMTMKVVTNYSTIEFYSGPIISVADLDKNCSVEYYWHFCCWVSVGLHCANLNLIVMID